MPKLLSDVAPHEHPIFAPEGLGTRQRLMAIVAQTIAVWSYAEHALGMSLAGMLRGGSTKAMEDYANTWRFAGNGNTRKRILMRAATGHLSTDELAVFSCAIGLIAKRSKRRNDFAHQIWGIAEALPDSLLLVHSKHLFLHWGRSNDWVHSFAHDPGAVGHEKNLSNELIEVWSNDDLQQELTDMKRAFQLSGWLEAMVSADSFDKTRSRSRQALLLLGNDPEVSMALQGLA